MKKHKLIWGIALGLVTSQIIHQNNKHKQKILYNQILNNAKKKFSDNNVSIVGSWIEESPIVTDDTMLCKGGLILNDHGQQSTIEFVSDMMDQKVVKYSVKKPH